MTIFTIRNRDSRFISLAAGCRNWLFCHTTRIPKQKSFDSSRLDIPGSKPRARAHRRWPNMLWAPCKMHCSCLLSLALAPKPLPPCLAPHMCLCLAVVCLLDFRSFSACSSVSPFSYREHWVARMVLISKSLPRAYHLSIAFLRILAAQRLRCNNHAAEAYIRPQTSRNQAETPPVSPKCCCNQSSNADSKRASLSSRAFLARVYGFL